MARMAVGDAAFMFTFAERFGSHVRRVVRVCLGEMGRDDVLRDEDELRSLVLDACYVIYERSSGWRPGGALPWTWARLAIRAEIGRAVGHHTVRGDDQDFESSDADSDRGNDGDDGMLGTDDFAELARRHPTVALLADAVRSVGSPRDQRIFIQYRLQKGLGDPSPAHVVAAEFGVTPANVRQIDCRMRRRVAAVLASSPRFESLREVQWFVA
jgi:hypothetical protein